MRNVKLPSVLLAELTYQCNHRCLFCSCPWENNVSLKYDELSAEEWKAVFEKAKSHGVKQITFTGGEATTRDDLFRILEYAHALDFSLGLISNGRNIDDAFLQRIQRFNVLLSVSVPGANPRRTLFAVRLFGFFPPSCARSRPRYDFAQQVEK